MARLATLLLIPTIWGLGFLAIRWGLDAMGPFWLVAWRFLVAGVLAAPFFPWKRFREWQPALISSVLLMSGIVLQTWGLSHTSVAKSAFITATYALIIPAIGALFLRQRIPGREWALLSLAMVGVGCMCEWRLDSMNLGDGLTLACALAFAVHILWLGRYASTTADPVAFSLAQIMGVSVLALPVALLVEGPPTAAWVAPLPLSGVLFLAILNTLVSFGLQMRVQQGVAPHVVGMVFLLESPIAAAAGWAGLGEALTTLGLVGAGVITLSALLLGLRSHGREGSNPAPRSRTTPLPSLG